MVKRPKTTDLESKRKAYKTARSAYKRGRGNKSNGELKKVKTDAKKALDEAEAAAEATPLSDDAKVVESVEASSKPDVAEDSDESGASENKDEDNNDNADSTNIKQLEEAYQNALSAFKADKTNKELRKAKSAALRTLDEAIAATTEGKQLYCVHCSKKFIFSNKEQQKFDEMGLKELPKRCESCKQNQKMSKLTNK